MGTGKHAPEAKPAIFLSPLAQSSECSTGLCFQTFCGVCTFGVLRACVNCWVSENTAPPPSPLFSVWLGDSAISLRALLQDQGWG